MTNRELVFLKPDAIERKLVGTIVGRFEAAGFEIEKMHKGHISAMLAELLYPDSDEQLEGMGNKTIKAMTDKGETEKMKELFGETDPLEIGRVLNIWNRRAAISKDVIAMVLKKDDAANSARALAGKTDPSLADKGTIRGDYGEDSIYSGNIERRACRNLIHASEDQHAEAEVKYFEDYFFK